MLLSQTKSEETPNDQPGTIGGLSLASPKIGDKAAAMGSSDTIGKDGPKSPTTMTTNNFTTVNQNGANINITNINNHHTYVIYR